MIRVNIYAACYGWLFEDLKAQFEALELEGVEVRASERPLPEADVWIALRTREGHLAPDPRRLVVCVHDLADDAGYEPDGDRRSVHRAAGLVLCHPDQRRILERFGVAVDRARVLERPLGALSIFAPRRRRCRGFNVGWVGRDHPVKRLPWLLAAMRELAGRCPDLRVHLIGKDLEAAAASLEQSGVPCACFPRRTHPVARYPELYRALDCLVITSRTEAGPLPLFEALASGLPVVSTAVGWSPILARRAPRYVRLAHRPPQIVRRLQEVRSERQALFAERLEMASLVAAWRLESWLEQVAELAASLAANPRGSPPASASPGAGSRPGDPGAG